MPRSGSVYAWWNLSGEQKQALDQARDSGMFGGSFAHPKYFWVQEGTINPAGAPKAGITPTNWLDNVLDDIQEIIADSIASVIGGS